MHDNLTLSRSNSDKESILTLHFALICVDLYKKFKWNSDQGKITDFHKFYEEYESMDEASLKNEFLAAYSK